MNWRVHKILNLLSFNIFFQNNDNMETNSLKNSNTHFIKSNMTQLVPVEIITYIYWNSRTAVLLVNMRISIKIVMCKATLTITFDFFRSPLYL